MFSIDMLYMVQVYQIDKCDWFIFLLLFHVNK